MNSKITIISILAAAVFVSGVIVFSGGDSGSGNANTEAVNNVSTVNGKQIIAINAKGGYSPKVTAAKADTPTVIKMSTQGTFDCSSALVIPSLGIRKSLPPSGVTDIEIPPQKAGTTIRGLCAMGMYNFTVNFD